MLCRPAGHPHKGTDISAVRRVLRCVRRAAPWDEVRAPRRARSPDAAPRAHNRPRRPSAREARSLLKDKTTGAPPCLDSLRFQGGGGGGGRGVGVGGGDCLSLHSHARRPLACTVPRPQRRPTARRPQAPEPRRLRRQEERPVTTGSRASSNAATRAWTCTRPACPRRGWRTTRPPPRTSSRPCSRAPPTARGSSRCSPTSRRTRSGFGQPYPSP